MKNVINWTIGSFFRTIGRIIAYIAIGSLILFAFSYKPKAATLTSHDTYTGREYPLPSIISSYGSNNTYSYSTGVPDSQGRYLFDTGTIGNTINGKSWYFSFGFNYSLTAEKYYDVVINFKSYDLKSNVNTSSIVLFSGSSPSNLSSNYVSLIGVTNTATSSSNTNKLTIRIYANSAVQYWGIDIKSDGTSTGNITSVNNFGISSITINSVDITNSNAIINNQTNNTQNIINNNNENTQQIIDSQNELLGQRCSNLFNKNSVLNNTTFDSSGNAFTANGFFATSDYIEVSPSTQYSLDSYNGYRVVEYNSSKSFIQRLFDVRYFTTSANTYYIKLSGNTSNINSTMLVQGFSSKPYCEYGSYSSKLDETNSSINNLNDTINDDSINDNDIQTALNGLEIPQTSYGPFQAFLTIPLQWVQTILSANQSCEPIVLPLPFVNQNLTLPCMTPFWTSLGALGTLIQALWIAVVAVRIFNGLFLLTIETLDTNPNSAVELTKIKSWEL